jgi:hypothetical protein
LYAIQVYWGSKIHRYNGMYRKYKEVLAKPAKN